MAYVLADSDILIDGLSGREDAVCRLKSEREKGLLRTSWINRVEVLVGASTLSQQRIIEEFLDRIPILEFNFSAARHAARTRRELLRDGKGMALPDCLIAGIALAHGAELLTRNLRHFQRVDGLRLTTL
ncbi:MAG: type II toxin-antitoxin system VapC family toxin [Candidatus Solibacter usitatus]|nr:type II toxin-antitoxin system VapC family toxin [Candidatus Solibacter usitatus]